MKRIALLLIALAVVSRLYLCGQCVYLNDETTKLSLQKENIRSSVELLSLDVAQETSITRLTENSQQYHEVNLPLVFSEINSTAIALSR